MARPKNTDARRAQIVAALLDVMAERGYERASVAEIGRRAGLTPGLIHYHFRSKQEILLQLIAQLESGMTARVERALEGCEDPGQRLARCVDVHLALGADADPRAVACWVAISAEAIRQPEVQAAYEGVLTRSLERWVGLFSALLDKRRARAAAGAVLAAIQGYYAVAAAAPALIPAGSAAPSVRRLVEALTDA